MMGRCEKAATARLPKGLCAFGVHYGLLAGLLLVAPLVAKGEQLPDSAHCRKIPVRVQQSCVEVVIDQRSGPRFLPSCLEEIEISMKEIHEVEQCIADVMAKRHQQERKDLAESMALRRSMVLSNLYSTLR